MGLLEEKKALERMSQAFRRVIRTAPDGAKLPVGETTPPASEKAPGAPQGGQGSGSTPSGGM
jgi:hypothetical protein